MYTHPSVLETSPALVLKCSFTPRASPRVGRVECRALGPPPELPIQASGLDPSRLPTSQGCGAPPGLGERPFQPIPNAVTFGPGTQSAMPGWLCRRVRGLSGTTLYSARLSHLCAAHLERMKTKADYQPQLKNKQN